MKRPIRLADDVLNRIGLRFRIGVYEELLRKKPDSVEVLMELGNLYTEIGRYRDGLKIDLKLTERLPDNPVVHYNLACSYSLLGRKEEAFDALRKAIELGFSDYHLMIKDRDLDGIRQDKPFRSLLLRCVRNAKLR